MQKWTKRNITERIRSVVPFEVFKKLQTYRERKRTQPLTAVREKAAALLRDANTRFKGISEDSYASRNEARKEIAFLTGLNRKIARVRPGGAVDLTKTIVDYGYDPEEAASDQSCGDYEINIGSVSGIITGLEKAGVRVAVGIKRVPPDEEYDD